MKRTLILTFVFLFVPSLLTAQTEWIDLSKSLNELEIEALAVDSKNPQIIFASSQKHLYKSENAGGSWKQVLGLRGTLNHFRMIIVDPLDSKNIYAGTDRGVERSSDGGKRWSLIFGGSSEETKSVLAIEKDFANPQRLWVGTEQGLYELDLKINTAKKVSALGSVAVTSILLKENPLPQILLSTNRGIYKSEDNGVHWEIVFSQPRPEPAPGAKETSLEQFDVEELSTAPLFSNLVFLQTQEKFYAATAHGILEGTRDGSSWTPLGGQNLPAQNIRQIAKTSKTFYAATDRGLFQWDGPSHSFREMDEGLPSKEIRSIVYNPIEDCLLVGTSKGIFRLTYPELEIAVPTSREIPSFDMEAVMKPFKNEPSILEIQRAAIQYAEVHPTKIEEWRAAVKRRAILPTVSLGSDIKNSRNVDLDRGGTNDPDKFITGPADKGVSWSVNLNWDLGNLIWNDDQTSIDTRSRLMVELRDDILNEVTHLFYERRRLQVERVLAATRDLSVQVEKELRLQELTANIDALTGAYLSKRLGLLSETSS